MRSTFQAVTTATVLLATTAGVICGVASPGAASPVEGHRLTRGDATTTTTPTLPGTMATTTGPSAPTQVCASGSVTGGGSTFVASLAQQWINVYEQACPNASIVYNAIGSGEGIANFVAGQEDYGTSDFMMGPSDLAAAQSKGGPVLEVPWAAGAVVLEYHLQGVLSLNLTPNNIADIFSGQVTRWDDSRLERSNPGVPLPNQAITVVHRSDGSGTTDVLTAYLMATAPSTWAYGSGDTWQSPTGQGAKGSDGVTSIVSSTAGAIGYAQLSYAEAYHLGVANVRNPAGRWVAPDAQSVTAALSEAKVRPWGRVTLDFTPAGPSAYPLSTTTWAIVYEHEQDAAKAQLLKSFLTYAVTAGQSWAAELGYAPLPGQLEGIDLSEIASISG